MGVTYVWWNVGMEEKGYVGAYMFMVSVVEYVSGRVYVMVWLVCRFIWVVKIGWWLNLKAWFGPMWYGLCYRSTI